MSYPLKSSKIPLPPWLTPTITWVAICKFCNIINIRIVYKKDSIMLFSQLLYRLFVLEHQIGRLENSFINHKFRNVVTHNSKLSIMLRI